MPAGADRAADEDVHAVHHALAAGRGVLDLRAHDADVRHLHGRARVRAAGPDHAQVTVGEVQHGLEVLGRRVRALLGLDLREAAELRAGARHHAGDDGSRRDGEAREQGLGEERVHLLRGDVGDDEVLLDRQADLARAVHVRQVRHVPHVLALQPPAGYAHADPAQARLFLRVHAEVGPACDGGVDLVLRGLGRQLAGGHAARHLRAEVLQAHLVDEPHHARLLAVPAVAVVAERGDHRRRRRHDFGLGDPRAEGDRLCGARGGDEPADQDVESGDAVAVGGDERQVVDVGVLEEIRAAHHAHVPLAPEVGHLGVAAPAAGDVVLDVPGERPRVHHLVRVEAREGVPGGVAHVIQP